MFDAVLGSPSRLLKRFWLVQTILYRNQVLSIRSQPLCRIRTTAYTNNRPSCVADHHASSFSPRRPSLQPPSPRPPRGSNSPSSLQYVYSSCCQVSLTDQPQETLSQCSPATFTWTPTTAPYTLTVTDFTTDDSFDTESEAIVVPESNSTSWIVDAPVGSEVMVTVRDADGEVAETFSRSIGEGSDECLRNS